LPCNQSSYEDCDEDDQFEQSLLTYIKKEELSTMKRDMRSLYRYPLDMSTTNGRSSVQPGSQQSSLLDQLTCCLLCNYSTQDSCRYRQHSTTSTFTPHTFIYHHKCNPKSPANANGNAQQRSMFESPVKQSLSQWPEGARRPAATVFYSYSPEGVTCLAQPTPNQLHIANFFFIPSYLAPSFGATPFKFMEKLY